MPATTDIRSSRRVAVAAAPHPAEYPSLSSAPFHPGEAYPEWPGTSVAPGGNAAYAMVRSVLADLGLDHARFGSADWNPIGDLVRPGASIVVKPNWVMHRNAGSGGMECLVTHPSILRAVLDYVMRAKPAAVVVGDAPLQDCDFDALMSSGFGAVVDHFQNRGDPVSTADFRRTTLQQDGHALHVREDLKTRDRYVLADLANRSLLEPISADAARFRVTRYDPRRMRENPLPGLHRYLVAKEVLDADLVVNLPKLKTHMKAGITASLKNLVGINGNKDYLPHHRKGAATRGGDNYPRFSPLKAAAEALLDLANRNLHRTVLARECNRLVYGLLVLDMKLGGSGNVEGGWYGNDTVWRMCLDLNRLLIYVDKEGRMGDQPARTELSITDAIVAGEGEGPLRPEPHELGLVLGALNPAASDYVSALLMGLDPRRIPIILEAFRVVDHPIACFAAEEIECRLNGEAVSEEVLVRRAGGSLKPPSGWRGHCELQSSDA